ncbi:hypothetical protein AgCh_019908 [Apium graveolens]
MTILLCFHLHVYSVFNGIIVVILRSFRSAAGGVDELLPSAQLLRGEQEDQTEKLNYASEDSNEHCSDDDDNSQCGSSAYEIDNDDCSSDYGMAYVEDDKETADNDLEYEVEADQETEHDLENKAEAFISKVIQGWKKELMMDKLQ